MQHVLDFEEVLKNYIPYQESLTLIKNYKKEFSDNINSIKKEMESIINTSKTLVLDESTQVKNNLKLKSLQAKGIEADADFRATIVELQNSELEKNFKKIIELVDEYCKANSIDIILNKSAVVYVNPKFEITSIIIDILKERSLYSIFNESDYILQDME